VIPVGSPVMVLVVLPYSSYWFHVSRPVVLPVAGMVRVAAMESRGSDRVSSAVVLLVMASAKSPSRSSEVPPVPWRHQL
jgi:hypothetical protein